MHPFLATGALDPVSCLGARFVKVISIIPEAYRTYIAVIFGRLGCTTTLASGSKNFSEVVTFGRLGCTTTLASGNKNFSEVLCTILQFLLLTPRLCCFLFFFCHLLPFNCLHFLLLLLFLSFCFSFSSLPFLLDSLQFTFLCLLFHLSFSL